MTTNSSRIVWVDWMKAAGIMMVVLYHTNIVPQVKELAYILCLPAFFFTAGMFADETLSFVNYARKKSLRLFVPYLVFGLLAWLAWLLVGRRYGADADNMIAWYEPLLGMLWGTSDRLFHNAPLWFLTCLISLEWLYFALSRCRLSIWWQLLVLAVIAAIGVVLGKYGVVLPWGIVAAMIMLPIYWLGSVLAPALKQNASSLSMGAVVATLFVGLIGVAAAWLYNPDIKISVGRVGNPVLFYEGVIGVVAFWFALAQICTRLRLTALFAFIGTETLWILGLHMPFFGLVKGVAMLLHVPLAFFDTTLGCLTLWLATFSVLALCLIPVCRRALGWIGACRKRVFLDKAQSPTSQNPSH